MKVWHEKYDTKYSQWIDQRLATVHPAPHTAASFPSVRTNHGSIGREKKCFPQWVFGSLIETQWLAIRHLHISHNSPYLPLKFCISIVFNFSYRTAVKPRRNEKQRLCNIWGGGKKGVLWKMCKWRIDKSFPLFLVTAPEVSAKV